MYCNEKENEVTQSCLGPVLIYSNETAIVMYRRVLILYPVRAVLLRLNEKLCQKPIFNYTLVRLVPFHIENGGVV